MSPFFNSFSLPQTVSHDQYFIRGWSGPDRQQTRGPACPVAPRNRFARGSDQRLHSAKRRQTSRCERVPWRPAPSRPPRDRLHDFRAERPGRQATLGPVPNAYRPEKILGPGFRPGSGRPGRLGRFHPESAGGAALGNRLLTPSGRAVGPAPLHREKTNAGEKLHVAGNRAGDWPHAPNPPSVVVSRIPGPRRRAVRLDRPFWRAVQGRTSAFHRASQPVAQHQAPDA